MHSSFPKPSALRNSPQLNAIQPTSNRGRRPNKHTLVLRAFRCTNKLDLKKSPKLEYLRAFMIRLTKKLIRLTVLNKKSKPIEAKFGCNQELLRRAVELIHSFQGLLQDEQLWSTQSDPAKKIRFSSFREDYCKEFFSNKLTSEIHDLIVHSLLDRPDPDNLKKFLKLEVKDKAQEIAAFSDLKDLLLSSQFKGIYSDNYTELRPCEQASPPVPAPAPAQPAGMATDEIIEHFRHDIDPRTTKSFIKEAPRISGGVLSTAATLVA